ncbi:histidine kinase [Bowmanella sp. Y26]|uniref:sensor histidine kinase n=1 Tax=Bowmanella yangjiangensis TaxID=2811230 RepID=UPI001BDC51B6|nr:ATP-binding protein [Bowmanella yangjiangensis]MBT1063208.1 histidine kinase [Bowmanella yangjiangensis]
MNWITNKSLYRRLLLGLLPYLAGVVWLLVWQVKTGHSAWQLVLSGAVAVVVLAVWLKWLLSPFSRSALAIKHGLLALKDADFSISIHNQRYLEMLELVDAYNQLTQVLRAERMTLNQRELLLDKVIQHAPLAMVLTDKQYVVFSNTASRELFGLSSKLEGWRFTELVERLPTALASASRECQSGLVSYVQDDLTQVYQLHCQPFHLHGKSHQLYLYQNLSREMSRKENEMWKRLIRLISHELNNSLAPIQSLTKSARAILQQPEHLAMLEEILDTISRRSAHLHQFIERYSNYSRLPPPSKREVVISEFFQHLCTLFAIQGELDSVSQHAWFDPAQIEQVMVNLVKNAQESGSDAQEVGFELRQHGQHLSFMVYDRGAGMTESQLSQALLPFYTTKSTGSGIGLTLCNEIISAHQGKLRLYNRDHGGLCVSFTLPVRSAAQVNDRQN